jgi:hypothetical protein
MINNELPARAESTLLNEVVTPYEQVAGAVGGVFERGCELVLKAAGMSVEASPTSTVTTVEQTQKFGRAAVVPAL